jgi:hypothetical protein
VTFKPLHINAAPVLSRGGSAVYATASFTPVAAAYSAGDIIDVAKEFAFRYTDGSEIPAGATVRILETELAIDATALIASEAAYSLALYSITPPSAQADNAAWTLASADLPYYRGTVGLGTPVDLGAALYIKTGAIDTGFRLATTGTSLFGELVTVAGFTIAAVVRQVTLNGIIL